MLNDLNNVDTSKYDSMVDIVEMIHHHRAEQERESSDTLYFGLLARYYRRIQQAPKEGYPVVACSSAIPAEIFYALNIVPMQLESTTTGTVATLKIQDEVLALAQEMGWGSSICSSHRVQSAMVARGWLPRPQAVVWGYHGCDAGAKSGEVVLHHYHTPGFCLDRPSSGGTREIKYLAQELGDLIRFLEELTQRRLDGPRLGQALENARHMTVLSQEIYRLRGAVPCPMSNRQGMQVVNISSLYSGTEEGIRYLQAVRDELRTRLEQGIGYARHEKFRLVGLFPPPTYGLKLLDWMEREPGAMVVAEPLSGHWGDWELDPAQPLESLARKSYASPNSRQFHGPSCQAAIEDIVGDSLAFKAQGAIFWANVSCPPCCGISRLMVDAMQEKAGLPTLVLYVDMLDPSEASHEEVKGQIEAFLEMLRRSQKGQEVAG